MKKIVGVLGILAVLLGCSGNVAFAADISMPIFYENVSQLGQVEITSETSVGVMEDGISVLAEGNKSVNLADMESIALNDAQVVASDILSKGRATGSITWDIPSGATAKGKTPFFMEAGESITLNFSYSPRTASVDFGLIAPNGRFYYIAGKDGSINQTINLDMRGEYYLAIRNNSSTTVSVYGFVNY